MKDEEADRRRFDSLFRGIKARQLPTTEYVEIDEQLGVITGALISLDPPEAAGRIYRASVICPVCGRATSDADRVAVSIEPTYERDLPVAYGAWAHGDCVSRCGETSRERGVPW